MHDPMETEDAPELYEISEGNAHIELIIEEQNWHDHIDDSIIAQCQAAALAALKVAPAIKSTVGDPLKKERLAVLMFSNDHAVHQLNSTYRGKDKPTNILSFPATYSPADMSGAERAAAGEAPDEPGEYDPHIGDAILALETIIQEAKQQEKPLKDHLTHLVIHGVLHLLGYDHETETEAEQMETLEKALLSNFEISNPYS
ncbi:MAG: endoribonuclease YbeY [Rhodomicrobium sp.]|nr:MAG: endoribonuclease YbeY [Rhodomicrobium sp.]